MKGHVMNKPVKKVASIMDLFVDTNLNIRQVDNYDLPNMKEQILTMGRIVKPILVKETETEVDGKKKKLLTVLSGNRRTLAGQELCRDGQTPAEVKEALEKVDLVVFSGLSAAEELALIIDHGSEKPISRTEVVTSVWRLDKQIFSEMQIIQMLYFALARYSGNEKKLGEVPTEQKAKEKFLRSWLHGTVGNYILAAAKMGEFVREQFILTHRSEDKLLKEGEKLTMRCSRDRITQLSQAISADRDTNKDGKGWSVEKGGEKFNALIAKFVAEDESGSTESKASRPSPKRLRELADVYRSPAIRNALLIAAGTDDPDLGVKLVEMDADLQTLNLKLEVLNKEFEKITHPEFKSFVKALLNGAAPAEVAESLKPFQSV